MPHSRYRNPPAFHSDDLPPMSPENAAFHVIPVPWETSVSYGGGTRFGPAAILQASIQLEAWLDGGIPGKAGIHTTESVDCEGSSEVVIDRIQTAVSQTINQGKFPLLLGGEHTLTLGSIRALRELGENFGVVQFDAHADLRDNYQGDPLSHGCVMKRILDMDIPIFQIGVRSLSEFEAKLRIDKDIPHLDAEEIARNGLPASLLPDDFPHRLFITIDVDSMDPSIIPTTGTPEPGGLDYYTMIDCLSNIMKSRKVLGADIVELAPKQGVHAPDFTIAKLAYKLMDLLQKNQSLKETV